MAYTIILQQFKIFRKKQSSTFNPDSVGGGGQENFLFQEGGGGLLKPIDAKFRKSTRIRKMITPL